MKKLTAGIFAGILTIVTVNAANAEIASGAYVRQQVKTVDDKIGTTSASNKIANKATVGANIDALDEAVKTNTGNITTINNTLGDGTTEGLVKDVANLKSNLGDAGSVADQIAEAIKDKADKATSLAGYGITDAYTKAETDSAVSTAISGLTLGTVGGDEKGVFTALTETGGKVGGTKSLIKNENVATDAAIATGKIAFTNDEKAVLSSTITKAKVDSYDGLLSGDGSVDKKIETALGEGFGGDGEPANVTAALALKQDKLVADSIQGNDTAGNVITAVTANDGTVTVTKGTMIPAIAKTATGTDGTFVLTAKFADDGTPTYQWENIEREVATGANE